MDSPIIELLRVTKSFGPVDVLKGVDLSVYAGKVTALVGDNGAGKSTLIKGLAGVQPYDSGDVIIDGKPVALSTPRDAQALGIEVVYQDLALCDNLDIVQNMFLGREELHLGIFDEGRMERDASETLSLALRPHGEVGAAEGLLALRRAAPDRRDRPLGAQEGARRDPRRGRRPHSASRRRSRCSGSSSALAEQGVGVVIISHNLADVFKVADYISVLYLGSMVAHLKAEDTNYDDVVGYITGTKGTAPNRTMGVEVVR